MCRVVVYDSVTRLPIPDARFWSPERNGFLRSDKAGDAGTYILSGNRGETLDVRAPGHGSQRLRLDKEELETALPPQTSDFRVRVVGGRSGTALPRIPIQIRRGETVVLDGRTDERGEVLVNAKVLPEDIVETRLATEGFVDGRERVPATPDAVLVELRVYYGYEPSAALEAQQRVVADRANAFLELCRTHHPVLATALRRVDDAFAELLEDASGWGPLLLPGPLPPKRWHEALLAERNELIAEGEALLRDRRILAGRPSAAPNPNVPLGTTSAPVETWVSLASPELDAAGTDLARKLRDGLTRAGSLFPVERASLLQEWVRIGSKGFGKPAADRVARIVQLVRAHEMLEVLRTFVRDAKWIARLRS